MSQDVLRGQGGDLSSELGLSALVDRLVRSHRVCRLLCRNQSLSQRYLDIVEQIRKQLFVELQQTFMREGVNQENELWLHETRDRVCRMVLDDAALTRLAIVAQQQPQELTLRRDALTILIQAIEASGQLRQNSGNELQQTVVQDTLSYVVQKIDKYNPSKGPLMAWVLDTKKWIQRRAKASSEDPGMQQSPQAKRIKLKSKLKGLIKKSRYFDLGFWLSLEIKGLLPQRDAVQKISLVSLGLALLLSLLEQEPDKANDLLTHMAYELFPLASRVEERFGDAISIDEVTFQNESPLLSELVRVYIQDDPEELCQNAMQTYPQAIFQVIALDRLDDKSWEEISIKLGGIPVSSLCGFYTRRLQRLAPSIRAYIQQNH